MVILSSILILKTKNTLDPSFARDEHITFAKGKHITTEGLYHARQSLAYLERQSLSISLSRSETIVSLSLCETAIYARLLLLFRAPIDLNVDIGLAVEARPDEIPEKTVA